MDEITLDNLTPVAAAMLASALLSFVWEWFPGIAEKWAHLTSGQKAWINAAVVLALSIGITAGACYWWGGACPEGWLWPRGGEHAAGLLPVIRYESERSSLGGSSGVGEAARPRSQVCGVLNTTSPPMSALR